VKTLIEPLETRSSAGFAASQNMALPFAGQKLSEDHPVVAGTPEPVHDDRRVRFGGTIGIDKAFELGFDHIALCAGAGRPTVIPIKNGLAPASGRRLTS